MRTTLIKLSILSKMKNYNRIIKMNKNYNKHFGKWMKLIMTEMLKLKENQKKINI